MEKNNEKLTSYLLTFILVFIYLIALIWILLFKMGVEFSYMENRNINLIPFSEFLSDTGTVDPGGLVLNIIIFIPLGLYSGLIFKSWSMVQNTGLFLSTSLLIESIQYFIRIGAFDITDIITNTSGGILGILLYKTIEKMAGNPYRAQKWINIIATAGSLTMIAILILLKMNRLPIRYQ